MKSWVRIAEAYDGGFTEFYYDLINEHSSLKIRETSFHYNAHKETLLGEVSVPSTLKTLEDILQFICLNIPKTYKVDMNY